VTTLRAPPTLTRQQVILYGAVLLLCASACTALVWLIAPQWWELSAYFWYSIPGNSFTLLPHEPAVLYAGTLYDPFLVATVGILATVPASVVDYQLFKRLLELKPLAQANQSRIARLAQRSFNWQPWWTIVVFAFSPIPFYPVRLAAPMAGYPAARYVSAVTFGRWPRYYLLAWGGEAAANWLNWNPIF
jgi:membrane protein YqaA with SNARE-associated domain